MKGILIPGYEELFSKPALRYEDVLKNISSDTIMMLLISLNAELNTNENHEDRQERLLSTIILRYSSTQTGDLLNSLKNYAIKNSNYDGTLFGRRYLLSMFIRELKRNNKEELNPNDPIHEYNFFIAYLLTIDDVNAHGNVLYEDAKNYFFPAMPIFPIIWAGNINQYEYNERVNPAFEYFKLLSFCKYAYDKYKPYLKELISINGFANISQYLGSFKQIVKAAQINQQDGLLKKLYFIGPKEESDINHLRTQTINQISHNLKINISDLKKMPLYETEKRGFMVIDEDIYKKKIYRGALFDLLRRTTLKDVLCFEDYKNDISKGCFEDVLFKGIVKRLYKTNEDIIHYDSNSNISEPDLYYRCGNDVFLIEFKDYLFPDVIISGAKFEEYEKYINERLVNSDRDKGVSQLVNNILNLFNNKYDFDLGLKEMLINGEKINIHPIICHTDFMFSMPGLNEYLNCVFEKMINEKGCTKEGVNRITVINLEVFFDLSLRGSDFIELLTFIKRYYNIISSKREIAVKLSSSDLFIESTTSFDEMYQTVFRNEMIDNGQLTNQENINSVKDIVGITQQQIDEIL